MIANERLDLNKYIGYAKPDAKIKTNFGDQYRTDATASIGGQYPWDPGRFNTTDILNRAQARKRSLNAHLGYVDPDEPLDTQLFIGLGRFVRHNDYDFNKGNPITDHKPQDNPDFNPVWVEAYKISPTIPPNKRAKSPMPTAANPDPHGILCRWRNNAQKIPLIHNHLLRAFFQNQKNQSLTKNLILKNQKKCLNHKMLKLFEI